MRRLMGITCGVTLSFALAGCGAGTTPLQVVSSAASKTTAARSARISEAITITPGSSSPASAALAQPIHADGLFDFASKRGQLSLTVVGQSVETIVDGQTIYERIPQLSAQFGGKPWLKIDLNAIGEAAGISGLGSLAQAQSSDPSQFLEYLRGVSGTITTIGHEQVRGVATTHYRAVVDLNKAAAAARADLRSTLEQISQRLGVTAIPIDVWIDGAGRARRAHQTIDYSHASVPKVPAGALPRSVDVTVEFYDFGTPVSVTIPSPDQVTDLGQILRRTGSGQGSGTASAATDALRARLLTMPPPGYVQQPDNVGDTGPSDLDKAARDDGTPDARQALTSDGFVAGYQRLWQKSSAQQLSDFVYQFTSPAGALAYLNRSFAHAAAAATPFAVGGIPGAKGLAWSDSSGPTVVVYFTRGRFLAQVVVHGADAAALLVTGLAGQQYQLLAS